MNYQLIPVTAFAQNCSLIWSDSGAEATLVDPGGDTESIKSAVAKRGRVVRQIILTHGHLDHVGAAAELAAFYQVPIIGPQRNDEFWLEKLPMQSRMFGLTECPPLVPDRWLEEGDVVEAGGETLSVLHVPGHTPGHIALYAAESRLLICGDVLFKGGVGRSDFPQGDHATLIASIKNKLLPLGDDVIFIPGHGPVSTLGDERLHNPFLQDEPPLW